MEDERVFHNSCTIVRKYSQLELMNIQINYENFLTNLWYLNIIILVGLTFILEC
jgi:hypothetical protein